MDQAGKRSVWAYTAALAVGLFLMFDRVGPWLGAQFEDAPPAGVRLVLEAGARLHDLFGLTAMGRDLDCVAAPFFEANYKNTYRCVEASLLADATPAAPEAAPDRRDAIVGQTPPPMTSSTAVAHTPAAQPPLRLKSPGKVLVVGDSLAIILAISLEKAFKEYDGLTMVTQGKVGSGLQNPQHFNWELALRQLLAEHAPVLVVVMMGANDAKYLSLNPDAQEPEAQEDKRASVYRNRLAAFLKIMDDKGVPACWVGLPIMGDPDLAAKSQALNTLVRLACQDRPGVRYMDTWPLLADPQGNYSSHIINSKGTRVRVREGDKVHFSTAGGDIIARQLLKNAGILEGLPEKQGKDLAQGAPTPAQDQAKPL